MGRRLACIFYALSVGGAPGCSTDRSVAADRLASRGSPGDPDDQGDDDQGGRCRRDAFEKNNTADDAATLSFDSVFAEQAFVRVEGFLCAREEDWFHIPTS